MLVMGEEPDPVAPPPTSTTNLRMEALINASDPTQQSLFGYRITNLASEAEDGLVVRLYFTPDGTQAASSYVLTTFFDQSNSATVSGPVDAGNGQYYFEIDYGAASLGPNSAWEFQGSLRLVDFSFNFDASNDWWHTGLTSSFAETIYIPIYINDAVVTGQVP